MTTLRVLLAPSRCFAEAVGRQNMSAPNPPAEGMPCDAKASGKQVKKPIHRSSRKGGFDNRIGHPVKPERGCDSMRQ